MKKKQPSQAAANLSVIIGNNSDKIQSIFFLNEEQITEILKDLFSRPNQLQFSDCEGVTKSPQNLRFPITGEMVVSRIIDAGKYPSHMCLPMANYLKNFERCGSPLGNKFIGQVIHKSPQACDLLISDWATKLTFRNRKFMAVSIFMSHPGLIVQYQNKYYETMKTNTKSISDLIWLVESFIAILKSSDLELITPDLNKAIQEIVKNLPSSELKKLKPIKYIDPNIPSELDVANQLVYSAVKGLNP